MAIKNNENLDFEIGFYESVLTHSPNYPTVLEILGSLYTKTGRIEDGYEMDQKLISIQPDNNLAHYNLACSQTLLGKIDEALVSLTKAISLGYQDFEWMLKDPDLHNLRNNSVFNQLVVDLKNKIVDK